MTLVFLAAAPEVLLRRFEATRRRHPLAPDRPVVDGIRHERELIQPLREAADLTIDTTLLRGRELSELIRERVVGAKRNGLSLLFRSFGFKFGVPVDADLVFDLRCLPNPYWVPELKPLTGRDPTVIRFLEESPMAREMFNDLRGFLERWLPRFENDQRTYLTVAIGCTGGQHRSVYMVEKWPAISGGSSPTF